MPLSAIKQATGGQSELVQTIAVPREHRPMRIPSFPALERTSVLSFTDTFTLVTDEVLSPRDPGTRIAVVRDPVFPLWRAIEKTQAISAYRGMRIEGMVFESRHTVVMAPDARMTVNTLSETPPAPGMPLYVYGGREFVPCLAPNGAVQINFNSNPGASALDVDGYYLDSNLDQQSFTASGACAVNEAIFQIGFVFELPYGTIGFCIESLQLTVTNNPTYGTIIRYGTTTSNHGNSAPLLTPLAQNPLRAMLPITVATEYNSAPVVWQNTRANSVAVLFSNVSAVLQKEGVVTCARAPSEGGLTMWNHDTWLTGFTKIHPRERYFGPLEKGLYTFTLPDAVSEVYHEYDDLGIDLPVYKHYLDGNRFCHCILLRDPDHLASLAVTVDRHIEFKSNSVLFPYGFSSVPLEAYHQSQMALANLGVFYENPLHLGTIASLARQAISKYGPRVAKAALPYAVRGANQILSTINAKLGKMQQAGLTDGKKKKEQRVRAKPKPKAGKRR